jgi:hypothetical protein
MALFRAHGGRFGGKSSHHRNGFSRRSHLQCALQPATIFATQIPIRQSLTISILSRLNSKVGPRALPLAFEDASKRHRGGMAFNPSSRCQILPSQALVSLDDAITTAKSHSEGSGCIERMNRRVWSLTFAMAEYTLLRDTGIVRSKLS